MAGIGFPAASAKLHLPNGTKYGFVHIKPSGDKPYLLLCHGFPSSSYDWRHQINHFGGLGYGVLAPDLLGYGDTDKPSNPVAYRLKKLCDEVVAILDSLEIDKVVGVAHDWGSRFLSRLGDYYPDRVQAFIFLDVGYQPPTSHFSLDAVNDATERMLGYPIFGYWHFFNSDDAASLMDRNPACTNSLLYSDDNWRYNMCPIGATRSWFEEGKIIPTASWVSSEELAIHDQIFNASNGGYKPALNWYKAQIANVNSEDEASLASGDSQFERPTLLVTCSKDPIAVADIQEKTTKQYAKNLRIKQLETGHWVQLEQPLKVNEIIQKFIESLH